MPELPEVETVVRTLRPHLVGRTVAAVRVLRPDVVTPATIDLPALLTGRRVKSINRRGKKILIRLDDDHTLCIHLGMTGRLTMENEDAPLLPHTHVVIGFEAVGSRQTSASSARLSSPKSVEPYAVGRHVDCGLRIADWGLKAANPKSEIRNPQLRFRDPRRFGGLWWLCPTESPDAKLGPEPLTITPNELAAALARTRRPIKTALLDQKLIAGLGNIYVDESLFQAAIHPATRAHRLSGDQIARLTRAMKTVLRKALRHRGSTLRDYVDATGAPGAFQKLHQVYGRESLPCRTCGTAIKRIVQGGRSTHFCARCQRRK